MHDVKLPATTSSLTCEDRGVLWPGQLVSLTISLSSFVHLRLCQLSQEGRSGMHVWEINRGLPEGRWGFLMGGTWTPRDG